MLSMSSRLFRSTEPYFSSIPSNIAGSLRRLSATGSKESWKVVGLHGTNEMSFPDAKKGIIFQADYSGLCFLPNSSEGREMCIAYGSGAAISNARECILPASKVMLLTIAVKKSDMNRLFFRGVPQLSPGTEFLIEDIEYPTDEEVRKSDRRVFFHQVSLFTQMLMSALAGVAVWDFLKSHFIDNKAYRREAEIVEKAAEATRTAAEATKIAAEAVMIAAKNRP